MSLIVAIRCTDGVVVGSDSAATFGSMGQATIRQTARKIAILDGSIICAVAGAAGLSQQFSGCLSDLWQNENFRKSKRHDMMSCISINFQLCAKPLITAAAAAKPLFGRATWGSAVAPAIVAIPHADGPTLFWFDEICAPEEVTDDLPFVSIGSGRSIADPFLALIKRVVWKNEMPTLPLGIFSAAWTLNHAIETNPGGVAGPIDIRTLTMLEGEPIVDEIDSAQMDTYLTHVSSAEERVATIRDLLMEAETAGDPGTAPIPMPASDPDEDSDRQSEK